MVSAETVRSVLRQELAEFGRRELQERLESIMRPRMEEILLAVHAPGEKGSVDSDIKLFSYPAIERDLDSLALKSETPEMGLDAKRQHHRNNTAASGQAGTEKRGFSTFFRRSYAPDEFAEEKHYDSPFGDRPSDDKKSAFITMKTDVTAMTKTSSTDAKDSSEKASAEEEEDYLSPLDNVRLSRTSADDGRESYSRLTQDDVHQFGGGERQSTADSERFTSNRSRKTTMAAKTRLSMELFEIQREPAREEAASRNTSCLANFVLTDEFNYASCLFVCLSAISMGLQTDYMARHWTEQVPRPYKIIDFVFCCIFVLELILRLCVHGLRFFWMTGWKWNVFDFLVISAQVAEEAIILHVATPFPQTFSPTNSVGILRLARIFRVMRILRLARVLHLFGELRTLLVSIADSVRSLLWVVLLLFLLVYVLGVYLTQVVTDYKVAHRKEIGSSKSLKDLEAFYGSVDLSMLTLYETIAEGIHWHDVMSPLASEVSPWLKVLFCVYSAFIFFAVLNIVTGAFVERAIRTGTEDKKKILMYQMKQLFEIADADGSGTISWEEFAAQLNNPQMDEYLKAIDLDQDEALDLFNLLDVDETGEIDAEDLVHGCLRLHGPAKSIDLATFMREYERQTKNWTDHTRKMERCMSFLMEEASHRAESIGDKSLRSSADGILEKLNEERHERVVAFAHTQTRSRTQDFA